MLINLLSVSVLVWGSVPDDFSPERVSNSIRRLAQASKPMSAEQIRLLADARLAQVSQLSTQPLIESLATEKAAREEVERRLAEEQTRLFEVAEKERAASEQLRQTTLQLEEKRRRELSLEAHLNEAKQKIVFSEKEFEEYARGLRVSLGEAKVLYQETIRYQEENYQLRQALGQPTEELPMNPVDFVELTRNIVVLTSLSKKDLAELYPALERFRSQ